MDSNRVQCVDIEYFKLRIIDVTFKIVKSGNLSTTDIPPYSYNAPAAGQGLWNVDKTHSHKLGRRMTVEWS